MEGPYFNRHQEEVFKIEVENRNVIGEINFSIREMRDFIFK